MSPQRLAAILRAADMGDAIRYFELAETIEERDLHYLGVLGTRRRAVAQLDISVEAASDSAADEAIARRSGLAQARRAGRRAVPHARLHREGDQLHGDPLGHVDESSGCRKSGMARSALVRRRPHRPDHAAPARGRRPPPGHSGRQADHREDRRQVRPAAAIGPRAGRGLGLDVQGLHPARLDDLHADLRHSPCGWANMAPGRPTPTRRP